MLKIRQPITAFWELATKSHLPLREELQQKYSFVFMIKREPQNTVSIMNINFWLKLANKQKQFGEKIVLGKKIKVIENKDNQDGCNGCKQQSLQLQTSDIVSALSTHVTWKERKQ